MVWQSVYQPGEISPRANDGQKGFINYWFIVKWSARWPFDISCAQLTLKTVAGKIWQLARLYYFSWLYASTLLAPSSIVSLWICDILSWVAADPHALTLTCPTQRQRLETSELQRRLWLTSRTKPPGMTHIPAYDSMPLWIEQQKEMQTHVYRACVCLIFTEPRTDTDFPMKHEFPLQGAPVRLCVQVRHTECSAVHLILFFSSDGI